ncbi:MAG: hypothetical protein FJ149_09950 [Euryarchaeota archaeon]|nr:hypothetical protein [Euryarchaeota archaeon]
MEPCRKAALLLALAVSAALLPSLCTPDVAAAPAKPQCAITRPYDNDTVSGRFRVTGTALSSSDPIIRVQLRIDGGGLLIANGTESWHFDVDTALLQNGPHTVEARSFDGTQYSEPAIVTFEVKNGRPPGPPGTPTYVLVALTVSLVAAMAALAWRLAARKRR